MLVNNYVVEERFSSWQKKKVRTIVVNGRSKMSSQRSIQGALTQARPYDRVELVGGEYFEALSINMPLEIVAAEGEDPRIVSRGLCLTVTQGVEAYFEHVEFISKGKGKLEAAVNLMHGSSVFFKCKMNSMIIGGLATPHIERCTITESFNGIGIQINDNAGAVLQNCIVHTHNLACVMIDTRGVVKLTENSLYQPVNGGHVLVVRAVQSFTTSNEDVPYENLSCRQVTIDRCSLYVTSNVVNVKDREKYSENLSGSQSCVVISHGAAPVFINNEILEGIVGFTFDIAGPAILRGNKISNQRECGVLVIVGAGNKNDLTQRNLSISGGNLIDRCFIGIDVHCRGRGSPKVLNPMLLPDALPSSRSAFSWTREVERLFGGRKKPPGGAQERACARLPLRVDGERVLLGDLIHSLRGLTELLLAGHPKHFFVESADTRAGGVAMSVFGDLLTESLGAQPPPSNYAAGAEKMLRLRGNCGVDIFETRFASCDLCAIRFGCNGYGLVENCEFTNCGATAIVLHSGAHPVIIGCKLNHSKRAGILIDGLANPLITGNEINFGAEFGIEVCNMSRGIIMGNTITSSNSSGICVSGGSSTVIAANLIQLTNMAGVAVADGSKPIVLMNKFISNVTCQVLVAEYSNPFIACNEFISGRNAALHFESCGCGTVVDNNIYSNGEGIVAELDADPYVVSNRIMGNSRYGILVRNNGLGTFVKNVIENNSICNVFIKEGGSPVLRDNDIHGGRGGGVVVSEEGCGFIEHNNITENALGNVVVIGMFSEPVFTSNNISSSVSGCGVICARGGGGTFSRNTIFQNSQCGVYVIGKANPTFLENTVSREVVGVIVSDGGRGTFNGNEILETYGTGFIIQLSGDPIVHHNRVSKCTHSGLLVAPEGRGRISENSFFENDVGIQLGSSIGTAELDVDVGFFNISASPDGTRGNTSPCPVGQRRTSAKTSFRFLLVGKQQDQRCAPQVPAEIMQNKIFHNSMCGVLLESEAGGLLENNDIEKNNLYGVMADVEYSGRRAYEKLKESNAFRFANYRASSTGGGTAVIRKNRIFGHSHANVYACNHPKNNITIAENDVYDAPTGFYMTKYATIDSICGNTIRNCRNGVVADTGGRGCFEGNTISNCHGVGVYISLFANPEFKNDNIIEKCRTAGVFVDAGGKGVFSHTKIRHCFLGVVVYTCPPVSLHARPEEIHYSESVTSAPTFEHCTIERNEHHGVLVLTVTKGFFLRLSDDNSPVRYDKNEGFTNAPTASKFPLFRNNTICYNRFFGVCHENYDKDGPASYNYTPDIVETSANRENVILSTQLRQQTSLAGSVATWGNKKNKHSPKHLKQTSNMPVEDEEQTKNRTTYPEALGMSTVLDTEEHIQQRIHRQVSFIENTISDCTIGVSVGSNCHPFLLKNRICKNTFFGLMLRCESKAMCHGCDVSENGMAGLYASPGSFGAFAGGSLQQNNGLTRFSESPNNPRTFSDALPVLQPRVEAPEEPPESAGAGDAFAAVRQMTGKFADVVIDGLRMLFELAAASPAGLSLASAMIPNAYMQKTSLTRALYGDFYNRVWGADGGIGAWIAQGSMTEVSGSTIENNRNAGIFFSRDATHHHRNAVHFLIEPTGGFPSIPEDAYVSGKWREASPRYFFTSTVVTRSAGDIEWKKSFSGSAKTGNVANSNLAAEEGDRPFSLRRPAKVAENSISKNGCGIFVHLFHVLDIVRSFELPEFAVTFKEPGELANSTTVKSISKKKGKSSHGKKKASFRKTAKSSASSEKVRDANTASSEAVLSSDGISVEGFLPTKRSFVGYPLKSINASRAAVTAAASETVVAAAAAENDNIEFCISFDKNNVYSNSIKGIACQHIVEMLCRNSLRSRGVLEDAVKDCQDICAQIMLHQEIPKPVLPFVFSPKEGLVRQARFSGNTVCKNPQEQMEITSRYIAALQDGTRILLNVDTMTTLKTSTCSSHVLLKVPLFAAFLQHVPPGFFLIEDNRFSDGLTGVRVVGLTGSTSSRLRRNTFSNITGDGVLVEGHLASTTVGNGNIFEKNKVGVRIVLSSVLFAPTGISQEEAAALTTCVYANKFIASKLASVTVEGLGGITPLVFGNEFSGHRQGSAAVVIDSATTKAHIMRNVFQENYVPFIVANNAGNGEGGSLVIEENRFVRNFIGMFICGGAAPLLMRNVFEENYRSGMEITGTYTSPIVSNCVFMNNKRSLMPPNLTFSGDEKFSVTGGLVFTSTALDERFWVFKDEEKPPSAGVTLGGKSRGIMSECLFCGNDIGVDAVSVSIPTEGEDDANGKLSSVEDQPKPGLRFISCILNNNLLAGVLVRGIPEHAAELKATIQALTSSSITKRRQQAEPATFDRCFFVSNFCDTESCGDVLSIDGGRAIFKKNLFSGCIHCGKDGAAHFDSNMFVSFILDVAVYMHKGTRVQLDGNVIRGYKTGIFASPAAWGRLEKNWILDVMCGVVAAPFSHTLFDGNRIVLAKECGVLCYGGVFSDNEICECSKGVIIRNPSEYKEYHLIPSCDKSAFSVVLAGNRVHSCDLDGIVVAGGGRVVENRVFNTKQNISIVCPRFSNADSAEATITKNDVYDGEVGIMMAKGSKADVRENDVFDNSVLGVWCKSGSSGVLQSNNISIARKEGAIHVQDSQVKVVHNTIRNQFSPSYQKTLAPQRVKERQEAGDRLHADIRHLSVLIEDSQRKCEEIGKGIRALLEGMMSLEGSTVFCSTVTLADTVSRALNYSARETTDTAVELLDASLNASRRSVDLLCGLCKENVFPPELSRRRSMDRRVSGSIRLTPQGLVTPVLIHVLSEERCSVDSIIKAKEAEALFSSAPLMSRAHFRTTLTSSSSALADFLSTRIPRVFILVVGSEKQSLDESEIKSLEVLRRKQQLGVNGGSDEKQVSHVFTLLPQKWNAKVEQCSYNGFPRSESVMSIERFAAAHVCIFFEQNFSEALSILEKNLLMAFPEPPLRRVTSEGSISQSSLGFPRDTNAVPLRRVSGTQQTTIMSLPSVSPETERKYVNMTYGLPRSSKGRFKEKAKNIPVPVETRASDNAVGALPTVTKQK